MNAVDTNVLIYACDLRDPAKQACAKSVIANLMEPVLLWQVACEFIGASRKLGAQGFTPAAAWAQLDALVQAWPLAAPSGQALELARELNIGKQIAFWDALIVAACLDSGVTRLYSEDLPAAAVPGLVITNPFL